MWEVPGILREITSTSKLGQMEYELTQLDSLQKEFEFTESMMNLTTMIYWRADFEKTVLNLNQFSFVFNESKKL